MLKSHVVTQKDPHTPASMIPVTQPSRSECRICGCKRVAYAVNNLGYCVSHKRKAVRAMKIRLSVKFRVTKSNRFNDPTDPDNPNNNPDMRG